MLRWLEAIRKCENQLAAHSSSSTRGVPLAIYASSAGDHPELTTARADEQLLRAHNVAVCLAAPMGCAHDDIAPHITQDARRIADIHPQGPKWRAWLAKWRGRAVKQHARVLKRRARSQTQIEIPSKPHAQSCIERGPLGVPQVAPADTCS